MQNIKSNVLKSNHLILNEKLTHFTVNMQYFDSLGDVSETRYGGNSGNGLDQALAAASNLGSDILAPTYDTGDAEDEGGIKNKFGEGNSIQNAIAAADEMGAALDLPVFNTEDPAIEESDFGFIGEFVSDVLSDINHGYDVAAAAIDEEIAVVGDEISDVVDTVETAVEDFATTVKDDLVFGLEVATIIYPAIVIIGGIIIYKVVTDNPQLVRAAVI